MPGQSRGADKNGLRQSVLEAEGIERLKLMMEYNRLQGHDPDNQVLGMRRINPGPVHSQD